MTVDGDSDTKGKEKIVFVSVVKGNTKSDMSNEYIWR